MNRSTMNSMTLKQYRELKKHLKKQCLSTAQTGQESKYNNRKVVVLGENFDSQKEADRWAQLKLMERAGVITDLQRQVKFVLIPSQKADGKIIERECSYYADFVYMQNGSKVVEDTKGLRTAEYIIKRKLMLHVHGIRVKET